MIMDYYINDKDTKLIVDMINEINGVFNNGSPEKSITIKGRENLNLLHLLLTLEIQKHDTK